MVNVKDQYDPDLRRLLKTRKKIAVIPVGSMEQHGPHLPVSTDTEIVTGIAKILSEKTGFLLLPTISYGVSFEHAPFFNLSLKGTTLQRILIDLILSLGENRVSTVFVINGHHGNQKFLKNLEYKVRKISNKKIKVFSLSYWNFMSREFDHAGLVETSLMLVLSNSVKMKKAKNGLNTEGLSKKEKKQISLLASKSFPAVTKNGIWGDPRKASSKEGQRILSEIVKNLEKRCQTCLTAKKPKLHQ